MTQRHFGCCARAGIGRFTALIQGSALRVRGYGTDGPIVPIVSSIFSLWRGVRARSALEWSLKVSATLSLSAELGRLRQSWRSITWLSLWGTGDDLWLRAAGRFVGVRRGHIPLRGKLLSRADTKLLQHLVALINGSTPLSFAVSAASLGADIGPGGFSVRQHMNMYITVNESQQRGAR
jgi:hypothetical protein